MRDGVVNEKFFWCVQVMWSTLEPVLPHSMLPSIVCGTTIVTLIILGRIGMLPEKILLCMGGVSAWTATLLFMWGPMAQMVSC